jgi:parallel beta-helix repeat protein
MISSNRHRPCLEILEERCALSGLSQPLGPLQWLSLAAQAARASHQAAPSAVRAPSVEVHAGQSIQAAVDAARPGTVVFLDPGTYSQSVTVSKPDVFLVGLGGPGAVVLDNPGGADNGVNVAPGGDGFGLFNVTVQGFGQNGVLLTGVHRFLVDGVTAVNDGGYGIFPVSSANGLVTRSSTSGNDDTGIYVGQSLDVAVLANSASENVNGIEVENSVNVAVLGNHSFHNTVGVLVDLLPDLPVKVTANTLVAGNVINDNNHPNFGPPSDIASLAPTGVGVFVLGTVGTKVRDNLVLGNHLLGVGVTSSELLTVLGGGPVRGIFPNPSRTQVRDNFLFGGGLSLDLLWDGSGMGNVFSDNTLLTSFSPSGFPSE